MFSRLSLYHQPRQPYAPPASSRNRDRSQARAAPYPDEVGMLLRLAAVAAPLIAAAVLIVWAGN